MSDVVYTFVIYNTNFDRLRKHLKSIMNQKYDLSKIQIIIEDVTDDDNVLKYAEKLHLIYNKCFNMAGAYNHGLFLAKGKYITFITSDLYYESSELLNGLYGILKDYNVVAINGGYFDENKKIRENYMMQFKKNMEINLYKRPYNVDMLLHAYFFETSLIKNYKFNGDKDYECTFKFLLDVLKDNFVYYYANEFCITSTLAFEDNASKCLVHYNLCWYIDSLSNFIIPELKNAKNLPRFIQEAYMYLIYVKFKCNINDSNKNVLSYDDFVIFKKLVIEALCYIDNDIISQTDMASISDAVMGHQFKMQRWLKFWLLKSKLDYLKANYNIKYLSINNTNNLLLEYVFPDGQMAFNFISSDRNYNLSEKVKIKAINYDHNELEIDAFVTLSDFMDVSDIEIVAELDGKKVDVDFTDVYSSLNVFGLNLSRECTFKVKFRINNDSNHKLKFYMILNNTKIPLNLRYDKVQARLSKSKRSFWCYKNIILRNNISSIIIEKRSKFKTFKYEILYALSKIKNERKKMTVIKMLCLRFLYYLTKPFYKHIWITFDKLYKAGDNGEYLYQYGLKHGKKIYYIINKDSFDYKRLKKQKRILKYGSLKTKLLSLHAEAILKTHSGILGFCGFENLEGVLIRDLFNAHIIEVQHGLTIQDIPKYQNRLVDNIKIYCCASKYEVQNILKKEYDFNKERVLLTGLARYDGLISKPSKMILITPTWRHSIASPSLKHGVPRAHNDVFKQSDYFKIYNSLINNPMLIKCAKENGYKIIYLVHPTLSGQVQDFDKNDYVEIIPATGDMSYEKILTEADLMVTDYSGVQFDFAYQRKPIVYYHPDSLPPHYETGVYNYKTMAFGSICKNEKDLVDELCYYMGNGCQIKDEYKKRADDFFAYNDYNNCQRIVEATETFLNEK